MEEEKSQSHTATASNVPTSQINHHHYLDDLEYGINIEDIDLDIK